MTNGFLLIMWVLSAIARIPRIVERWKAPFLNGPGWFFGIQVPPDFQVGAGRRILATYRMRLFLPWAFELPVAIALFAAGQYPAGMLLVMVMTLLTRLAYYANRKKAEDAAREFQVPGSAPAVALVSLSLEPRRLRDYTNPWVEAAIGAASAAPVAFLAYLYAASGDWHPLRVFWMIALVSIYVQIGLLLMKRGFVRARTAAPAENAEAYMLWRESLRRLSTTLCDYMRVTMILPPMTMYAVFLLDQVRGANVQTWMLAFVAVAMPVSLWFEWRRRNQHLKVARETKPVELLVRPDTDTLNTMICFRPSLPMLLIRGPKGYALNLASMPAFTATLYFAGGAALLAGLAR